MLVSNSDAHSPPKLAREANVFDAELSYPAIYRAWKEHDDKGFLGTIEFFPEEGKYHYDGHRLCKTRLHPAETKKHNGDCPVCGKSVTVGVMARVEELADRKEGIKSPRWRPYTSLIPLPEVIAEAKGNRSTTTKGVTLIFDRMLKSLGNELYILQDAPLEEIEKCGGPIVAEGVRRMRAGEVRIAAGYDGEYGTVKIFTPQELKEFQRQSTLVDQLGDPPNGTVKKTSRKKKRLAKEKNAKKKPENVAQNDTTLLSFDSPQQSSSNNLNQAQTKAIQHDDSHVLIVAGPGTGKTHTLVHRIVYLVQRGIKPEHVLAITFTNKAAEEMRRRLAVQLGKSAEEITVGTFHAFCLSLLREHGGEWANFEIIGEAQQKEIAKKIWPQSSVSKRKAWLEEISHNKNTLAEAKSEPSNVRGKEYDEYLRQHLLWDFDDLLIQAIRLIENETSVREKTRSRFRWIFVDEYQDINAAQHRLLKLVVHKSGIVTAIGDPNQAIYGFRGSEVEYFTRFKNDFPGAAELHLAENYRSGANILSASGQVMEHSREGSALNLSPALLTEGRVTIYAAPTDKAEAEYVVHQIEKMIGGTSMFSQDSGRVEHERMGERTFGDIAILYRLNALRAPLKEALQRSGMPYQISGEVSLSQRKGVQALTALIRATSDSSINAAGLAELLMLLTPGFGESLSSNAADYFSRLKNFESSAILKLGELQNLNRSQSTAFRATYEIFKQFEHHVSEAGLCSALEKFLSSEVVKNTCAIDSALKQNWQKLLRIARRYDTPRRFMDALSLQNEADDFDPRAERIALMTLHASKGLEFPIVFIVGCEESLTPMQLENLKGDPEEERRLFYVGMTRAKEELYLLRASRRMLFGKTFHNPPSRFLSNIEEQLKAYEYWKTKPKKKTDKVSDNQLKLF